MKPVAECAMLNALDLHYRQLNNLEPRVFTNNANMSKCLCVLAYFDYLTRDSRRRYVHQSCKWQDWQGTEACVQQASAKLLTPL